MIGIGAMIGAGIFVLTGIAAGEAGPGAIIAFGLNGIITLFTALSYAELSSSIPEAGGGYSYVKYAFPKPASFLSGWMLWFAYTVACSLYAMGFGSYAVEMSGYPELFREGGLIIGSMTISIPPEILSKVVAVLAAIVFIMINVMGAEATGKAENIITGIKIAILIIFIVAGLRMVLIKPDLVARNFSPLLPNGFGGVISAMGLTFIAFEGYDLIATAAEEIKDPKKTIPRAIAISLTVSVSIYLLVVFTSVGGIDATKAGFLQSWQFLGAMKETAIMEAAKVFMGGIGILVLGFGGIFSTTSALNATILASSRVAFTMGRDQFLPQRFSTLDPKRNTPKVAILITSVVFILVIVFLPIAQVASATSLFFLLTFVMVNLSLIRLRQMGRLKQDRFRVPLFPALPVIGVIANLYLAVSLYRFDPVSWKVGLIWIIAGIVVYVIFVRKSPEIEMGEEMFEAKVLPGNTVLLSLANLQNNNLVDFAVGLAKSRNARLVILNVLQLPWVVSFEMAKPLLKTRKEEFQAIVHQVADKGVNAEAIVAVSHDVVKTILSTVEETHADILILGWRGKTKKDYFFGSTIDPVVRNAKCDVITAKIDRPMDSIQTILVSFGFGVHIRRALKIVRDLAILKGVRLTLMRVTNKEDDPEMDKVIEEMSHKGVVANKRIVQGDVVKAVIKESEDYDLLVLGSSETPFYRRSLFGTIADEIATNTPISVIIVKSGSPLARGKERIYNRILSFLFPKK